MEASVYSKPGRLVIKFERDKRKKRQAEKKRLLSIFIRVKERYLHEERNASQAASIYVVLGRLSSATWRNVSENRRSSQSKELASKLPV